MKQIFCWSGMFIMMLASATSADAQGLPEGATEAMVTELPEDKPPMPMPGGGDMGGMGGMGGMM